MKKVTLYTDGACSGNPGPGGWGFVLLYGGRKLERSGGEENTTNNRMELTAVIRGLEALKEPCEVALWSDSSYVINGLEKGWAYGWKKRGWKKSDGKPALNPELWEQLLSLTAKHTMEYHWVKGHAENEYNNRCDELAVAEWKKLKSDAKLGILPMPEEMPAPAPVPLLQSREDFMREALVLAKEAAAHGDVPVGCIIVKDGKIIGRGRNRREEISDATAHAELEAVREACGALGTWNLNGAELYVTLEPCPMCAGGIINSRLAAVYYGAKEEKSGCCGSVLNLFEERFNHHPKVYGGILAEECAAVLRDFFEKMRLT